MATIGSFFNGFLSLFLLFFHLGCFSFFPSNPKPIPDQQSHPKRRKITPLTPPSPGPSSLKPQRSLSIRSYLNNLFTFRKPHSNTDDQPPIPISSSPDRKPEIIPTDVASTKPSSFTTRSDIFACEACGEVLSKPHLLDLHQATKHSLSELRDGDSGKNIVQIIFHSGWKGKSPASIHRILKIHNTPRTLARFEEYRDTVRSRAAWHVRTSDVGDQRCIADGNERLRFYCSTVLCAAGPIGVCGSQFCSTCAIVKHGFTGKQVDLDGIATHATSWGAHVSLPAELEEEFAFLHVRRAMLVCRVVAGRVARGGVEGGEEKGVFDSVVPVNLREGEQQNLAAEEELLVFNPRAVLPCFVIIYSA